MKRNNLILKKITICLMIVFIAVLNSHALLFAADSVELASKNVFALEVNIVDDADHEYYVRTGTCFLIGNIEEGQSQYLVTSGNIVGVDESYFDRVRQENQLKDDAKLTVAYKVIVSDSIAVPVNVYSQSQEYNYAVFSTTQKLADKSGIAFGNKEQAVEGQNLAIISYVLDYYSTTAKTITRTKEYEKNQKYSVEEITDLDYGCAVVDSYGYLYGVSTPCEDRDDNVQILTVAQLIKDFDTLGIEYQVGDYSDGHLSKAQIAMLVLAALIILFLVVLLIILIRSQIKASKVVHIDDVVSEQDRRGSKRGHKQNEMIPSQVKKRSKAGEDFEATVAVSQTNYVTAFIVNHVSGERTLISKTHFVLGSQQGVADYVVTGNRTISRQHAIITNENGIFYLMDNNSTNHTYLNNVQLNPKVRQVLRNHDKISLAGYELEFVCM